MWAQQREKMGRGRGMSSGTQRELSAEFAGGALKSMGMSKCSNAAQVLEVEEVQRGRGLSVAGRTNHRLGPSR